MAAPSTPLTIADCGRCARPFVSRHGASLCNPLCGKPKPKRRRPSSRRTPASARAAVDRRRLRRDAVYVEDVDVLVLAERDRWTCHLCGLKVWRRCRWPHPKSASVDHLVPLNEGGEHSYRNTALAHLRCNLSKGTKPRGEQLRLLG